jgi:hypothetical protein
MFKTRLYTTYRCTPMYIQQDATLHSLFISGNCCTCFGWYFNPPSGAHTTVSTASGICHAVSATYHYSRIQMLLFAKLLCNIAHSIICTRLFRGKMHSDWFNGTEMLQGRWQHGENVGHCYPSGLKKTLCKWDMYVPLVTKVLNGVTCIYDGVQLTQ